MQISFKNMRLTNIFKHIKLLLKLSQNEFKSKYMGNTLGIMWAFIQPTITILIFWFVFQVGFKSQPIDNFPFILWLIIGMLPWFFIAESLSLATNSILANNFLVKKIVFKVSLLPIVPIFTTMIVHLFFILFVCGMFIYYGYSPTIYWLQIFYYLFSASILIISISWITSSLIVFFKDVGQIIAMLIQFGFWLTPIFWSINIVPEKYRAILIYNPFYYIIEGYRDSFIYENWFWDKLNLTVYFWGLTIIILIMGVYIFKKLKPHFADVI